MPPHHYVFIVELAKPANYQLPFKLALPIGLNDGAFLYVDLLRIQVQVLRVFLEAIFCKWKFAPKFVRSPTARRTNTLHRHPGFAESGNHRNLNELKVIQRGPLLALLQQLCFDLVPRGDSLRRNASIMGSFPDLIRREKKAPPPWLIQPLRH